MNSCLFIEDAEKIIKKDEENENDEEKFEWFLFLPFEPSCLCYNFKLT